MRRRYFLAATLLLGTLTSLGLCQEKKDELKTSPSKITAVTVYQNTALVTREVKTPETAGLLEITVSPLPPTVVESSLYAEGGENLRVLSTRFRTRQIAEDTRDEVRKAEAKIKDLTTKLAAIQADVKAAEENMKFVGKLEGFTASTTTSSTEVDSEKTIKLANFIRESRLKHAKEDTAHREQMAALNEEINFIKRSISDFAGRPVRTERDAIVTIDKANAGATTIKLNYLVSAATWRPQYKLRAGKENAPIGVEYLASVGQRTGESWDGVALTLSTAQPMLSAAPPDLRALEISVMGSSMMAQQGANPAVQSSGQSQLSLPPSPGGGGRAGYLNDLNVQSAKLRKDATDNFNKFNDDVGNTLSNSGAALDQYRELLLTKEEIEKDKSNPFPSMVGISGDGPSVTYNLKSKMSVPSRTDEQTLEIARFELAAKNYFKAVPVLSPNVYRVADVSNTTDFVMLPGEATMYIGTDFVGRAKLPMIAIGKPFTVGFGVDPQLTATRKLIDKSRSTQGGNQQLKFNYQILVSSYKSTPVDVQVWDRLPMSETAQVITVTLTAPKKPLSTDPLYERDERPKNLLRWDVKIEPKQNGDKAMAIDYEYKLELDKNVNIAGAMSK